MQCPMDHTQLVMSERSGIEIDYCPQCRGVWLDRGELDKMIDRAESHSGDSREEQFYEKSHHGKGKKRGFLGELFD